jgi:hypothetical protein
LNFYFEAIDLNQESCQKAYGKGLAMNIEHLGMNNCNVKLPLLDAMLKMSPNLDSLEFECMDHRVVMAWELAMDTLDDRPPITEVTHLKWLDSKVFISALVFKRLLVMCPKLQSITLSGTHPDSESNRPLVSEGQFERFLKQFGHQLKAIAINELNKPLPYVSTLVKFGDVLELEELRLQRTEIPTEKLNEFLLTQKNTLNVLNLTFCCGKMIDSETIRIINGMPELRKLELIQIDASGIKEIRSMAKLKVSSLP